MTKGTPTCLSMDFMMEFMPRDANVNEESMFVQSDGPVQVLGVYPPSQDSMILARPLQINIKLDRHVDFRSIAQRTSEMAHMCQLQNDGDLSKYFAPKRYQYEGDNIFLLFSFAEDEQMLKDIYHKVPSNRKQAALCWSLQCQSEPHEEGGLYFSFLGMQYKYCFGDGLENESVYLEEKKKCNPLSKYKLADDGSCICTPPYKGPTCEDCISGYVPQQREIRSWGSKTASHTVCVADSASDEVMCNNFGRYNSITKQCDCQSGYAGQFCDVCDHPSYEYPDCTGEFDADMMDS